MDLRILQIPAYRFRTSDAISSCFFAKFAGIEVICAAVSGVLGLGRRPIAKYNGVVRGDAGGDRPANDLEGGELTDRA